MYQKVKQIIILAIAIVMVNAVGFFEPWNGSIAQVKASALFKSPLATVANDSFSRAQSIGALPFNTSVDITSATLQASEPVPSCVTSSSFGKSIWYVYKPAANGSLMARINGWNSPVLAVYNGSSLRNLSQIQCTSYWNQAVFTVQQGATYYFQIGDLSGAGGYVNFSLEVTPPPQVNFNYYPYDPSIYDQVWFSDSSYDPAGSWIQSGSWNFGDGSTSLNLSDSHQFAADGDYLVQHAIVTVDGRTSTATRTVMVRTRDVYISAVARPSSAIAGQTKPIMVNITNDRYPETVRVDLYKSVPGGYQQVAYSEQFVDTNTTIEFYFNYTFTSADAKIGKVTFKAIATIMNGRDALPADNEFITLPIVVTSSSGRSAEEIAAVDDMAQYVVDQESNQAADGPILPTEEEQSNTQDNQAITKEDGSAAYKIYMPLIEQ